MLMPIRYQHLRRLGTGQGNHRRRAEGWIRRGAGLLARGREEGATGRHCRPRSSSRGHRRGRGDVATAATLSPREQLGRYGPGQSLRRHSGLEGRCQFGTKLIEGFAVPRWKRGWRQHQASLDRADVLGRAFAPGRPDAYRARLQYRCYPTAAVIHAGNCEENI